MCLREESKQAITKLEECLMIKIEWLQKINIAGTSEYSVFMHSANV